MKGYLLALLLMVLGACALIVYVADQLSPTPAALPEQRPVQGWHELSIDQIVGMVGPAVVAIDTRERRIVRRRVDDPLLRYFFDDTDLFADVEGIGSGVIIDPRGYVLTSAHVVGRAQEIAVTLADGRQLDAELCALDRENDLAVLILPAQGLPVAAMGDSGTLEVGQWVLAFGNPFGTASKTAQPSVSAGVISALRRRLKLPGGRVYDDLIQTDAAINSGNNGGPLVDLGGRVVGLNALILTSAGASTGVGFALPIDTVKERLNELTRQCERRAAQKGRARTGTTRHWRLPWRGRSR